MKKNKRVGLTSVQIRPQLEKGMKVLIKEGMTKSQIINEALRQYLLEKEWNLIREKAIPYGQVKGLYTDEDVEKFLR